jgi:hypothetical protein
MNTALRLAARYVSSNRRYLGTSPEHSPTCIKKFGPTSLFLALKTAKRTFVYAENGGARSVSANFFNWWPKGPLELFNGGNSGPLSLSIGGPDTSMSVKGPPISAKN